MSTVVAPRPDCSPRLRSVIYTDRTTASLPFARLAGPEVSGPGRRLDSTETAPDPAPALAAAAEAEARRAAQEEARRKDVADKRAAFLARLSP